MFNLCSSTWPKSQLRADWAKYGALSVPDGRVTVEWSVGASARHPVIVLRWQEHGGPRVVAPQARGMGLLLLSPQGDILGVDVDFAEDGLRCTIEVKAGAAT